LIETKTEFYINSIDVTVTMFVNLVGRDIAYLTAFYLKIDGEKIFILKDVLKGSFTLT